jgi:hypothetical protein
VFVAKPRDLTSVVDNLGRICVGASAVPLTSTALANQTELAVSNAVQDPVLRSHPHPHVLFGRAGQLRSLLAGLPRGEGSGGSEGGVGDADRLADAVISGRHRLILDVDTQILHVIDGTEGAVIAGRVHAAGNQPVALVDPTPADRTPTFEAMSPALAEDPELRSFTPLNRTVARQGMPVMAAPETLSAPLWTQSFCEAVVGAAETAVVLTHDPLRRTTPLPDQANARLLDLLEADLEEGIRRIFRDRRSHPTDIKLYSAFIVRCRTGDPIGGVLARTLLAHSDRPLLVGSVRLNDSYQGGSLVLPRQAWDDRSSPVGALTVWPSSATTHPYRAAPVTRGVKYRLTIVWRLPDASVAPEEKLLGRPKAQGAITTADIQNRPPK